MNARERLAEAAERIKRQVGAGAAPEPLRVTVRELLSWSGHSRRGSRWAAETRRLLGQLNLRTEPDIERSWIDGTIAITLDPDADDGIEAAGEPSDPTVRVDEIDAAHRRPSAVTADARLRTATTLMQMNDFSQLPVMNGETDVEGIVSWESIGSRLAMGHDSDIVRDCMDTMVPEVGAKEPLFSAIDVMRRRGYVLVRGEDRRITGIVTWGDVTDQFVGLARPFLIIGEIEGYLRGLVRGKFGAEELRKALPRWRRNQSDADPGDLTLGGYCHLLGDERAWERLGLNLDQEVFVEKVRWVRDLRNDVMHFRAEGLEPAAMEELEEVANFFRRLRLMGSV